MRVFTSDTPVVDPAWSAAGGNSSLRSVLTLYIGTALVSMSLGVVLGAYNLVTVALHRTSAAVLPSWIQARGHAEIFGWLGTTVLMVTSFHLLNGWPRQLYLAKAVWVLWTAGLALRWLADASGGYGRELFPVSATLELLAFALATSAILRLWRAKTSFDLAILLLGGGAVGCALALVENFLQALRLALAHQPVFSPAFERRFLLICIWGFLVPIAWGLCARWLPGVMSLKPAKKKILVAAGILDALGILAALFGTVHLAAVLLLHAAIFAPSALRVFGRKLAPCELQHPLAVRLAFAWLRIGATLGAWASIHDAPGIWAASRHSLTAGFLSSLVFVLAYHAGPRLLSTCPINGTPAFAGSWLRLRAASLALLNAGCLVQVFSLLLADQRYAQWAWALLPVSACLESGAFLLLILNVVALMTAGRSPARLATKIAAAE
jgi:uncharacterized protein involved in response to NO